MDLHHSGNGDMHFSDWTVPEAMDEDYFNFSSILSKSLAGEPVKYFTAGMFYSDHVDVVEVDCDTELPGICQIDCDDIGNK